MAKSVIDSEENKRFGGSFNLPGNFEVKKEGPLDTRMVVGSITELLETTTINGENKYQYYGMLVVVSGDNTPENDGVYRLLEDGNPNEISGWEKIGTSNSDDLLSNTTFDAHTGDTTNPHKTSFDNLISTAHTHTITDITDLQSELDNKLNTSDFDIYSGNVQTQLDGKLDTTTFESYTGSVKDVHVSSGTVNAQSQSVTFTNTTGGTFDLENAAALFTDSDSYVTGGTYNANTGIVSYINSTGGTFDVTGFTEGITDTYVTNGTLEGTTLKLTKSDSSTVNDIELSGLKVWDKNNTNAYYNTGNVGIGISSPSQKLDVNGVTKSDVFAVRNGANTRIISPEGAEYEDVNDKLGRIKITAPANISSTSQATQFKSTIKVFYSGGLFDLHISCYIQNNGSSTKPMTWQYAYIDSPPDRNNKYNFKVNLYFDENNKFAISIGEHDSSWGFLKVVVTDVILGFNNDSIDDWSTGWNIELDTNETISTNKTENYAGTPITTISATQVNNWEKVGNSLKYSVGDVNISNGRLIINDYILPTSKGDNGDIIQINSNGDLDWVDASSLQTQSIWTESGSDIYYNTGNVGIGTDTPLSTLHVESSGVTAIRVKSTDNANAGFHVIDKDDNAITLGIRNEKLKLNRSGSLANENHLVIDSSGNVGINTDSPSQKLEVAGTVFINDTNSSLTINDYTFPTSKGANGQVLKTDSNGNLTWQDDTDTDIYTQTASLSNNTLTFTRNDAQTYDVDLSPLQTQSIWTENTTTNTATYDGHIIVDSISSVASNDKRILSPEGARYYSNTEPVDGSFIIKLPFGWTDTHITLTAKIYDYAPNEHLTLNIAGYTYSGSGGLWARTSAWIEGNPKDEHNFNVRFGYDSVDNKCVIIIGETNSEWNRPKLYISDLQVAGSNYNQDWHKGWGVELSNNWSDDSRYVVNSTYQNTQAHNWVRNTDNSIIYNQGTVNIGVRSVSENNIKLFATRDGSNETGDKNAIPIEGIGDSTHTALGYGSSTSNSYGIAMGTLASSGKSWIQSKRFKGDGTQEYKLLLNPLGGEVGIGTSSPTEQLEVVGNIFINDTSSSLKINDYTLPAADGNTGQVLKTDGSGNVTWQNDTDTNTSIWSEKASNAYYSTGNVGIGTDSPTQELEVAGVTKSDAFALYNTHHTRIISPEGAELSIGDTTQGRIRITAPPSRASQTQTQFRATIKVFDDDKEFDVHVSCYLFNNQNIYWKNAWIDSPPDGTNKYNFKVTLYYDVNNKFNISIGEHDSSWRYAKIMVTDVILGVNHRNIDNWSTGWSITLDSDTTISSLAGGPVETISATQANNWKIDGSNNLKYESGNVKILGGNSLTINNYTLPAADGNDGQVLKTNGSGVVTWQNDTDTNIFTQSATLNESTNILTFNRNNSDTYTVDLSSLQTQSIWDVFPDTDNIYYNTGNVGIGQQVPSTKLHIAQNSVNAALTIEDDNTTESSSKNLYINFKRRGTSSNNGISNDSIVGSIGFDGVTTNMVSAQVIDAHKKFNISNIYNDGEINFKLSNESVNPTLATYVSITKERLSLLGGIILGLGVTQPSTNPKDIFIDSTTGYLSFHKNSHTYPSGSNTVTSHSINNVYNVEVRKEIVHINAVNDPNGGTGMPKEFNTIRPHQTVFVDTGRIEYNTSFPWNTLGIGDVSTKIYLPTPFAYTQDGDSITIKVVAGAFNAQITPTGTDVKVENTTGIEILPGESYTFTYSSDSENWFITSSHRRGSGSDNIGSVGQGTLA
jgi:hypothetical protein